MTTYTIDTENSITAFASAKQAEGQGESFSNQQELAALTAEWPVNRLIEIWNGIPGLTPVKKFTDRKSALTRIWKAIQSLGGGTQAETAPEQPKKTAPAAKPTKTGAPVPKAAKTTAKAKPGAKAKVGKTKKPAVTREGSKKAEVLGLLQRKGGATLAQIMKATGWQAHSVRGFVSGALGKKMGLTVNSERRDDGERVYTLVD
jgi:Protein of unknown function (DUF3489)